MTDNKYHTKREDVFALFTGALCVGFGVFLIKEVGLLTGGTAGLALILSQMISASFGQIFFLLNLPFYILAYKRMGWRFTLNTFIAVISVSLTADYMHLVISVDHINSLFAAIFGGLLLGLGMLILFRHRASLGGVGILALYLQEHYNIRAGKFQLAVDLSILAIGFFIVNLPILALSIVGAVTMNIVIAINHKPGRYFIS